MAFRVKTVYNQKVFDDMQQINNFIENNCVKVINIQMLPKEAMQYDNSYMLFYSCQIRDDIVKRNF